MTDEEAYIERLQPDYQKPEREASFAASDGSPDQWRELALASMKVCYYRPHPREWWDDAMKEDALKEYETAMRTVRELKAKLGL
jgi:hypothetical protein